MNLLSIPLPLVGDAHPLRIRYRRYLTRSIVGAVALHIMIVTAWIWPRAQEGGFEEAFALPDGFIIQPAPIQEHVDRGRVNITNLFPQFAEGIPLPVEDWIAPEDLVFPDQDELSRLIGTPDERLFEGTSNGPITWDPPVSEKERFPGPKEFIPVEELPALITIPAPVYPELARQAGVEGTVMIRVLVGKNGKVLDALVTEGIPMLNEVALAAAYKAIFRPALQQNRPVAVWVQIPIRFVLD